LIDLLKLKNIDLILVKSLGAALYLHAYLITVIIPNLIYLIMGVFVINVSMIHIHYIWVWHLRIIPERSFEVEIGPISLSLPAFLKIVVKKAISPDT
jgi:hypothetical protein